MSTDNMDLAPVEVAIGILYRNNGEVLLARRPPGKPFAGYWEFPGGKIEPGENPLQALKREFMEELGISVLDAVPLCTLLYTYPHAKVQLHTFVCKSWLGEPTGCENQELAWQTAIRLSPLLPTAKLLDEHLRRFCTNEAADA